jgi:carbonic anhydrase/acetyltransferase-like protein (isoleucine patch superfamily)
VIEENVFIGTGAVILGGCQIGHHSVIGAGVVLKGMVIPPYSRVQSPRPIIEGGYYANETPRPERRLF